MKLCHEVPFTAVENLTLATPALRFKLHAHTVGEGTILAKTTTLSPSSVKKTEIFFSVILKVTGAMPAV